VCIKATSSVQNIFSVVRRIIRDNLYLSYRRIHSFSRIVYTLLRGKSKGHPATGRGGPRGSG
jgi:hypothetical protein